MCLQLKHWQCKPRAVSSLPWSCWHRWWRDQTPPAGWLGLLGLVWLMVSPLPWSCWHWWWRDQTPPAGWLGLLGSVWLMVSPLPWSCWHRWWRDQTRPAGSVCQTMMMMMLRMSCYAECPSCDAAVETLTRPNSMAYDQTVNHTKLFQLTTQSRLICHLTFVVPQIYKWHAVH